MKRDIYTDFFFFGGGRWILGRSQEGRKETHTQTAEKKVYQPTSPGAGPVAALHKLAEHCHIVMSEVGERFDDVDEMKNTAILRTRHSEHRVK